MPSLGARGKLPVARTRIKSGRFILDLIGIICGVGFKVGEILLDERGRIVIPKEAREKLNLKPNQRLLVRVKQGEIILKPPADAGKFIAELRGCVSGSRIKPSELKEIWGIKRAHH